MACQEIGGPFSFTRLTAHEAWGMRGLRDMRHGPVDGHQQHGMAVTVAFVQVGFSDPFGVKTKLAQGPHE